MPAENPRPTSPTPNRLSFSLDPRIIILLLLAVIAGMLVSWKPWAASGADDQTIEVTGEAKVTAEPDQFIFYPSYQFKSGNKETALSELSKKSESVVAKLKELGVADNKIKTNSSGNDYPVYLEEGAKDATYTLQLTITVDNRELAQKVQDYLLTTTPVGAVSPQASFSEAKRKELENKARDEATKDARAKAEKSVSNLGFRLGKVKSVTDSAGFGGVLPVEGRVGIGNDAADIARSQLIIQPGENELHYSVTVSYFIR